MFKKVVTILFCTALLLSGCQKQPSDRTEWGGTAAEIFLKVDMLPQTEKRFAILT